MTDVGRGGFKDTKKQWHIDMFADPEKMTERTGRTLF
jgi:hypothetical protein